MTPVKVGNRWYLRKRHQGQQFEISLLTDNKKIATTRLNRFLGTLDSEGLDAAKAELSGKNIVRGGIDPSFEEMASLYRDYVEQSNNPPRKNTVVHNLGCLRRLMTGFTTISKIDTSKIKIAKTIYGASQVRAAKSIFKPQALQYYKSRRVILKNPFAEMELISTKTEPYIPMSAETRQKVRKECRHLPPINAMIVILALETGLRRNEIDKARKSWLRDDGNGKTLLTVQNEKDFTTKSRSRRSIPIPTSLAQEILTIRNAALPLANDPYLLPHGGVAGILRQLERFKEVSTWLKNLGIDDQKPLHALRKEFGSMVATKHGMLVASTFLGHSSIVITQNSYASLVNVPTIDLGEMIMPKDPLEAMAEQQGVSVEDLKEALEKLKGNSAKKRGIGKISQDPI